MRAVSIITSITITNVHGLIHRLIYKKEKLNKLRTLHLQISLT